MCSSLYLTCCSRDVKGLWQVLYTTYETMKKNVCYVVLSIVIWLVVPINIYTRSFKSTETNDNVLCSEIIRFFIRRYRNIVFNLNHNVLFYLILWNKNRCNELIQSRLIVWFPIRFAQSDNIRYIYIIQESVYRYYSLEDGRPYTVHF